MGLKQVFKHHFNPIGTKFSGNSNIKTLKDLRFFTSLDDGTQQIVANCPNLIEVWVPETMTHIASWFSLGTPRLKTVVMCGKTPPALSSNFMYIDTSYNYPKGLRIFVPDDAISKYKQKWANISNNNMKIIKFIYPMSEYHP